MGEKRRKFVPIVEVDEDWQPLFMVEDDDELRACPGKLGCLYAREFLNRRTIFLVDMPSVCWKGWKCLGG